MATPRTRGRRAVTVNHPLRVENKRVEDVHDQLRRLIPSIQVSAIVTNAFKVRRFLLRYRCDVSASVAQEQSSGKKTHALELVARHAKRATHDNIRNIFRHLHLHCYLIARKVTQHQSGKWIYSLASQVKAASRFLKAGNLRRE
jgi:hypothetical protein